ncbi:hypothetical protein WK92_15060 [Burkholderia ubonensis]|uniref:tetratricopeptide repeat protein n=1 Tax=Burkholderia ubonensis TaxID=101571 RepID=UPI00075AC54E|nr:tetratricopeptide repeat-containing glycosyltransferase family protein [Burkholderia ubonensis]KVV48301.1 hypothetical protein WK82_14190 [Burkholderia ubonensis]KVW21748.1 hypothetical protein WK92_15060 [Burkholderia ubonensis]
MDANDARTVNALLKAGRGWHEAMLFDEAEEIYRRILDIDRGHSEALHLLAVVHLQRGQVADAEILLRQVIDANPGFSSAHCNLGLVLKRLNRAAEAEAHLRKAIQLNPDFPEAFNNLGLLLEETDRYTEAEYCYRRATSLHFALYRGWFNLGNLMRRRGQLSYADACYRLALQIKPDYGPAQVNRAVNLLALGRYSEAWPLYEYRYVDSPDWRSAGGVLVRRPHLAFPQWHGEALGGKSLIVLAEQGAGDCIQFARFVPLLKKLGLSRLSIACPPSLLSLMGSLGGVDECFSSSELHQLPEHDYWCFMMSTPLHLGIRLSDLPTGAPYVGTTVACRARWRKRIRADKYAVGLVWSGDLRGNSPLHWERRSMGATGYLPLLHLRDVTFVSLQKGDVARAQLHDIPASLRPFDPMGEVNDFSDTAAIIEALDLVITVDTAVAHLCGALNKEAWVLLRDEVDWQWALMCDESPWYPGVLRLFRQERSGDWDGVIARVVELLRRRLGNDALAQA